MTLAELIAALQTKQFDKPVYAKLILSNNPSTGTAIVRVTEEDDRVNIEWKP